MQICHNPINFAALILGTISATLLGVIGALLLGVGMCLCMVFAKIEGTKMETEKVYAMPFAKIYPMLFFEQHPAVYPLYEAFQFAQIK